MVIEMNNRKELKFTVPKLKVWMKLILYLAAIMSSALSVLQVSTDCFPDAVSYVLYTVAAITLFTSVFYIGRSISYFYHEILLKGLKAHDFTARLLNDYRYRTVLFTNVSFFLNLVFVFLNLFFGIRQKSWWFITLSAYYLLLSSMRFAALHEENRNNRTKEKGGLEAEDIQVNEVRIYRNCGIIMMILTLALLESVVLILNDGNGKSYPGYLIFVVAGYTFYKIILSVINLFRVGKFKSPLLKTIRHIGYADAMMSLLSLQTAMFASFGTEQDVATPKIMNGLTGGVVCLMILAMGICMVASSSKINM